MKKILAILSAIILACSILTALSACGDGKTNAPDDTSSNAESSQTISAEAEESQTSESTSRSTENKSEKIDAVIQFSDLETVLNRIKSYPIGTAGSSYKCIDIAITFINYTENTEDSDDYIRQTVNEFFADMSDSEKESVSFGLEEINYGARDLVDGNTSWIGEDRFLAAQENYGESYSLSKYERVYKIIKEVL